MMLWSTAQCAKRLTGGGMGVTDQLKNRRMSVAWSAKKWATRRIMGDPLL